MSAYQQYYLSRQRLINVRPNTAKLLIKRFLSLTSIVFTDLDQLNHILGVLGSPSQEDLMCIMNEKVKKK